MEFIFKTRWLIILTALLSNPTVANIKNLHFAMLEGSEAQNISLCVVQEAYQNIGIATTFSKFPTSRSLHASNGGQFDGELSRIKSISKKFGNLIRIPVPILYMKAIAFNKKVKNFIPNGFSSLSPYRVIINHGAQFARIGTEGLPNVQITNSYTSVFNMLVHLRGDLAVAPFSNGLGLIRQLDLPEIKPLQPPLIEIPLFHFLHKKNEALIPFVQKALKVMQKSGRIQQIYSNYLIDLVDKTIPTNFNSKNGPSVPCP